MTLAIGLRNLGRVREILSILVDYGFGYVFDQLDLAQVLPVGRRREVSRQYAAIPGPRRLRLALAALGPVFIKLGQMLSARADLLAPPLVAELRLLQDAGPTVPFDEIRGLIETELGRPLEQCFRDFDREPLSSASLGQVHKATLEDGREVTVKVLRPGVRRVVEADLQILGEAAQLLQRQVAQLHRYDLPGLVRRLSSQIEDEMVYTLEAHHAERIRRSIEGRDLKVRVPEVLWDRTTREVLTVEMVRGYRVDRIPQTAPEIDRAAAARDLGLCILHQVFAEGFFHGDPHQGNVLVADDGRIVLLDFGIVGYLDPETRWLLAEMVARVSEEDIGGLVTILSEVGALSADTDLTSLRAELARLVGRFVSLPRRDFPVGALISRMLRALWVHNMRVPTSLALTGKALLMAEAVATELDPDFNFLELAQPALAEERGRLLEAGRLYDRAVRAATTTARRISRLPARLENVLSLIERGGLRLRLDDPAAAGRVSHLTRGLNRLALSLLSAALLLGSALHLSAPPHPVHVGLGIAALVAGVVLGMLVALAVLRPGRL
jgi:ubiquinone biosynthesis protein